MVQPMATLAGRLVMVTAAVWALIPGLQLRAVVHVNGQIVVSVVVVAGYRLVRPFSKD